VKFLFLLFHLDPGVVSKAVEDYLIGTTATGGTIFWQVDPKRRIRTGKIICYDPVTGKRKKNLSPSWIHAEMRKAGLLKQEFQLEQCFFGEHLLAKFPNLPIAIVESEKSAVIGSICKGAFPDRVWLACGGKSNLNSERLARLGKNRKIILYPDADGFEKWQRIAADARRRGQAVVVSDLIEKRATAQEKAAGYDLADYLIREQKPRNDPTTREVFRDLIEERRAIMTFDGGLSDEQADEAILYSGFYRQSIREALSCVSVPSPRTT
jgi:hypothetical protein